MLDNRWKQEIFSIGRRYDLLRTRDMREDMFNTEFGKNLLLKKPVNGNERSHKCELCDVWSVYN